MGECRRCGDDAGWFSSLCDDCKEVLENAKWHKKYGGNPDYCPTCKSRYRSYERSTSRECDCDPVEVDYEV